MIIYLSINYNKGKTVLCIMSQIHDTNDQFPFDSLKLLKPISIPGGSYFIKFNINNAPLYIQPPKCKTKQGFLKAGKRLYTDLMFTNENEDFISWMENLENKCHEYLHKNRDKWFDGDMELHDIENYFTSPLKLFKTGKFYIARIFVPTNQLGDPALTIYDEDNTQVNIDTIDETTDIISIIEMKGIKCTATSFQIEMEMKQLLTVKHVEFFSQCLIKKPPINIVQSNASVQDNVEPIEENKESTELVRNITTETTNDDLEINTDSLKLSNNLVKVDVHDTNRIPDMVDVNDDVNNDDVNNDDVNNDDVNNDDVNDDVNNDDVNNAEKNDEDDVNNTDDGLEEFKIHLDDIPEDDGIVIKNKNDVYYDMYREACRKAKIARDLALSSYLEAKRIKNTYMLDDISDSDENDDSDDSD
jgi:hypothetical protein